LQQLAAAQIIRASKEGRHVFYHIDAGSVAARLEAILAITRLLESAMGDNGTATKARRSDPRKPMGKRRSHAR
jgi:aminopeptidase C